MELANQFKNMDKNSWKILDSIFNYMWDYKYVPSELISKKSGIPQEKVEIMLRKLAGGGLVTNKQLSYFGTAFTFYGLSLYSLWRLVRKNVISMLGNKLGEGKESVVYNAISERYGEVVIKFHRVGYPSFKKVKEKRDYGTLHFTVLTVRSAKNEFKALKKLAGFVNVPIPYKWEGNAVVMELIEGVELYKVKLRNPEDVLDIIIDEVKEMYRKGVVHGDLSQYNILVSEKGVWIIDFPQSVLLQDEEYKINVELNEEFKNEAKNLLERDVKNILKYFEKSYKIKRDFKKVIDYIIESN